MMFWKPLRSVPKDSLAESVLNMYSASSSRQLSMGAAVPFSQTLSERFVVCESRALISSSASLSVFGSPSVRNTT